MSDLVAWYLVELRCRLSRSMDAKRVETIVGETRSHLLESITRLKSEMQLSDDAATVAAVNAFGSPEKVALAHLREHAWRPLGIQPMWLVVSGAFVSTTCWLLYWQWLSGYFDNFGATWENGVAGLIAVLATIVFGVGCYAGRRRYRGVTLAVGASMMLGIPILYSFLIVGSAFDLQGLSRLHLGRDVAMVQRSMTRLDRIDSYLTEGKRVFAAAKEPADVPAVYRDPIAAVNRIGSFGSNAVAMKAMENDLTIVPGRNTMMPRDFANSKSTYLTPSGSVFAMVDGRIYTGLTEEDDFSHAVLFWRRNVEKGRDSVAIEKQQMTALLASATEARNGRIFFFNPRVYSRTVASIPFFLPVLLLVEACVFAAVKRRRAYPEFAKA